MASEATTFEVACKDEEQHHADAAKVVLSMFFSSVANGSQQNSLGLAQG